MSFRRLATLSTILLFVLVVNPPVASAQRDVDVRRVKEGVRQFHDAVRAVGNWSYRVDVEQNYALAGEGAQRMVVRVLYSRKQSTAAAVSVQWRDGVEKTLPTAGQWRSAGDFIGGDIYNHVFADESSLVSYSLYDRTPENPHDDENVYRNVAVFRGDSAFLVPHNVDIATIISRPLLFYAAGSTENLIDLILDTPDDQITLANARQRVGGRLCLVATARTDYGRLTLWLDDRDGWIPRKALFEREPSDLFGKTRLWEAFDDRGVQRSEQYVWRDFSPIGAAKIPSRFDVTITTRSSDLQETFEISGRGVIAQGMEAVPEAVQSYIWTTDTIPDGADAAVFETAGTDAVPIPYTWDGEAVRRIVNPQAEADINQIVAGVQPDEEGVSRIALALGAAGIVAVVVVAVILVRRQRIKPASPAQR